MTESLFDTTFAAAQTVDSNAATSINIQGSANELQPTSSTTPANDASNADEVDSAPSDKRSPDLYASDHEVLPAIDTSLTTLINYRVLVSAKESGCLIGQNGQVIDSIREETNTKAGISKLLPGSHERILTVSGTLDNCSKALSYFAQALCNASDINDNLNTYSYFPLKQLSLAPCVPGQTTLLRLLIPNSQMGTLIGSKGIRIQKIQSDFNISMIASKSFLANSNERLVELQGTVNNLYDALRVISRCLIEDFSSIVGTNYYIPRPQIYKRRRSIPASEPAPNTKNYTTTSISFSNDIVGALIGKNGSRIQGVRKVSGAIIGISDEVEGNSERIFTISGTPHSVEKAKSLLYHNLEREEQRRLETTS